MATSIGGIFATLGANVAGWVSGMKAAQSSIQTLQNATSSAVSQITSQVGSLGAIGTIVLSIKTASDMEQTKISFTTLLGSADAAQKKLDELKKFAASTPFQFTELTNTAKKMLAIGTSADNIIPHMRILGDTVSALGGNSEMLDRMVKSFGQMASKGRVSAEEMNELANTGLPAWKLLADAMGTSVAKAMDLAEKKAISSAEAIPAIFKGMQDKFQGGMENQSQSTAGIFSNLKDKVTFILADLGKVLTQAFNLRGVIESLGQFSDMVKRNIGSIATVVRFVAVAAAGFMAFSAVLRTAAAASRAYAAAQAFILSMTPLGAAAVVAGVAVAVAANHAMGSSLQDVTKEADKFAASAQKASAAIALEAAETKKATDAKLRSAFAIEQAQKRQQALKEVLEDLKSPQDKYNESRARAIMLESWGLITYNQMIAAINKADQELDKHTTNVGETIKKLQEQRDTYGQAAHWAEVYQLKIRGASKEAIAQTTAIAQQIDAMDRAKDATAAITKAQNDFRENAKQITEDTKLPLEKYADAIADVQHQFKMGMITLETAQRQIGKLRNELTQPLESNLLLDGVAQGSKAAVDSILRARQRLRIKEMLPALPPLRQPDDKGGMFEVKPDGKGGFQKPLAEPPAPAGVAITAEIRKQQELQADGNKSLVEIATAAKKQKFNVEVIQLR